MTKKYLLSLSWMILFIPGFAQNKINLSPREHVKIDKDWRFAFGHPYDVSKDFNNAAGYFSYFAKASYGDGAAAASFDDRAWRKLDIPHDWAVEQPFDSKASLSHGFKAIGRNFPEASVGWYRKNVFIPKSDEGKRISIAFDGVFRNSIVWINGFYLGTESSGYTGFEYNISEYLNYGGENIIAVRVDATMEEGWFYEGAGIYRHAWLNKTAPVHVVTDGTFITSRVNNNAAAVKAAVTIINEGKAVGDVQVRHTIIDGAGRQVAASAIETVRLDPMKETTITTAIPVNSPTLWSLGQPYLYTIQTELLANGISIDQYNTTFGIRTIYFDANKGFFLNGKSIKIKGTNNHQDHAGVGIAIPDALQEFRLKQLKAFGNNAYRCSHNPPTPELLDACDRLGILVIDENRLLGASSYHFNYLKRLMLRDRNHPSIISWSIGNEEWGIEGNQLGAKIATTLQDYAKSIDSTRIITAAISGGWQKGISNVIDAMGVNYIGQINTDQHHAEFPHQPMWGTEEGSTRATRGIYVTDNDQHMIAAYDKKPIPNFVSIEDGWKHFASRDYLAGMFIWTGFDYRGEPTPFGWPSVTTYFGMLDLCGFPKDNCWYLKSWWTNDTVLHILPHWNWKGKEGQPVDVWVYSNCDEVELFLNKKSVGKQRMQINGHLQWKVNYTPGNLQAIGYKNGKKVAVEQVSTTAAPASIQMTADRSTIVSDGADVAVITVGSKDTKGLHVPTADDEITFSITGPGKIIGVGNGNPVSLEKDRFIETINTVAIDLTKEKVVASMDGNNQEAAVDFNDTGWDKAFKDDRSQAFGNSVKALVYRGSFIMPPYDNSTTINFFSKNIGVEQTVYLNGIEIASHLKGDKDIVIDKTMLHPGKNIITISAVPLLKKQDWDVVNVNPGIFQLISPAVPWKRKLFSGLAQVIVQSTGEKGQIVLSAVSKNLTSAAITIAVK